MVEASRPPGYSYGSAAPSPVSSHELALLKQTVLFNEADERALRMAGEVLADQVDAVLDVWYAFVAAHPHLAAYFATPDGDLIPRYLERVRARFGQWIVDTCNRTYDQTWLDYQYEIAWRHTRGGKNRTDEVSSTPDVALRYLIAFIYPISTTIRPFLASKGHSPDEVEAMREAWFKSVTMQIALWSQPYAGDQW